MTHVFMLILIINGNVVTDTAPMYFFSIHRCNHYVQAVVSGKQESRGANRDSLTVAGYCVPKLVDPDGLKVYS